MKISNKIHRGTSIAAAVISLVMLLLGTGSIIISSLISYASNYERSYAVTSLLSTGISTISWLLMIIALFRGKKDAAAGVMFLVTILPIMITGVIGNFVNVIVSLEMNSSMGAEYVICAVVGSLISIIANLASVALRAAIAVECFNPGKFSGGKMKSLLVILPIANIALSVVSTAVRQLYLAEYYQIGELIGLIMLPAVISAVTSIGTVLMGIAFSIPVYETNLYGYTNDVQSDYNLY